MAPASLKRLETKINRMMKLVERIADRDVVDVAVADEGNRSDRAARYIGLAPSTLATWRALAPSPGPKFSYSGTTPVYSKQDLDVWLVGRRASGRKRAVSPDVGRPAGGKRRSAVPR